MYLYRLIHLRWGQVCGQPRSPSMLQPKQQKPAKRTPTALIKLGLYPLDGYNLQSIIISCELPKFTRSQLILKPSRWTKYYMNHKNNKVYFWSIWISSIFTETVILDLKKRLQNSRLLDKRTAVPFYNIHSDKLIQVLLNQSG